MTRALIASFIQVTLASVLLALAFNVDATVRNAASCSQADVEAKIADAVNGDTVQVPGGNCSWSGLALSKGITLNGTRTGAAWDTVITTTGDNTFTKNASAVMTISNFHFVKTNGGNESKGITLTGSWRSAEPIIFRNNKIVISATGFMKITTPGGIIISNNDWTGGWDDSFIQPKDTGDTQGSWRSGSTMGTADTNGKLNIYIEDNTFYGGTNQGIDADDGARVVFRYNDCTFFSFNSHGMDTSEDGVRHFEVNHNTWHHNGESTDIANQSWLIWIRGGTGVIYGNAFPNIAGGWWGNKDEAKFDCRSCQDGSGSAYGTTTPPTASYSSGTGNYPRERQLGQSWCENLTNAYSIAGRSPYTTAGQGGYCTDPIYAWGNTGAGSGGDGSFTDWGNGGSWGSQTGFFDSGRDYVWGSAKSGYTEYTYPHPLAADPVGGAAPVISGISNSASNVQSRNGSITLNGTASNTPTGWSWSFTGNTTPQCSTNSTSSQATVSCINAGTVTPCATATNASGTSAQFCGTAFTVKASQGIGTLRPH